MIIKKLIETYIDIDDPSDVLCIDINKMLLEKLTNKFVGVCYKSGLILKINKIIRRSYIYLQTTLDGYGQTSVKFEVDVLVYKNNEVINGCKIIKKEPNGIIHATSKYAGIQMSIQQNMSIFKEGDIVPIIVKRVRYNINHTAISVLAMPFIPIEYSIVYYKLTDTMNDKRIDTINRLIKQIDTEEDKVKQLSTNDKKIFNFFVDLQHSSKSKHDISKSSKIHITKLLDIKDGYIFKTHNKYDDAYVNHVSSKADIETTLSTITGKNDNEKNNKLYEKNNGTINPVKILVVEEKIHKVYKIMLTEYLSNLQALQDFIEQYPSFESVQRNKNLWKMYNMLKK